MNENQQKISKLISYWLRHQPEDGALTLDQFGWAKISSILKALQLKNIDLTEKQLIALNNSFDKVRWKIDGVQKKIKATHGHSIFIEQELSATLPDQMLFHGTASKNIIGIINNGLVSGQRQAVHLSDTIAMATQVGKRHGKPFLIAIDTTALCKNGWEFYKTEQNVWLTKDIPSKYLQFNPWSFNVSDDRATRFKKELKNEVPTSHQLYKNIEKLNLIAWHKASDDCLFIDTESEAVYDVHLTWSGNKHPEVLPITTFKNLQEWIEKRLLLDQKNWYL